MAIWTVVLIVTHVVAGRDSSQSREQINLKVCQPDSLSLLSLSLSRTYYHCLALTYSHSLSTLYFSLSLYLSLLYRLCREISFQFRTRLPHGLLVYHNVKNPDRINLDPYALYVIVEKGQLKVVHVFGKHSTSVTVGESLNRDEWHSVMVSLVHFGGFYLDSTSQNVSSSLRTHSCSIPFPASLPPWKPLTFSLFQVLHFSQSFSHVILSFYCNCCCHSSCCCWFLLLQWL